MSDEIRRRGTTLTLTRGVLLALVLLELLAGRLGWRGLSWLGAGRRRVLLPLAALLLHPFWPPRLVRLLAALPLALPLQAAAASLLRRAESPLLRLAPGSFPDRSVARVEVPMPEQQMPALYVVPPGGAAAAVAVLHGSGCDKTYFAWRLTDALLAAGLAVLLVDLDGHGDSLRPQRWPQSLECATGAVAWLRGQHAAVGLLGISLGGSLAARAVADGLAVDALALLETPQLLQFTNADRWREARFLPQPYMLDLLGEMTVYGLGCAVYDLVKAQRAPRIRSEVSTWELIAACDLLGSLRRIAAPLLLVYGERDAIVPPAQAEAAWQAAPPGSTMLLVPDASHLTLILHPAALRRTAAWLAERLAGRA